MGPLIHGPLLSQLRRMKGPVVLTSGVDFPEQKLQLLMRLLALAPHCTRACINPRRDQQKPYTLNTFFESLKPSFGSRMLGWGSFIFVCAVII